MLNAIRQLRPKTSSYPKPTNLHTFSANMIYVKGKFSAIKLKMKRNANQILNVTLFANKETNVPNPMIFI